MTTSPPGLDLPAVGAWLQAQGVALGDGALSATLFPGGKSNVTYRLTGSSGDSVVLRRPPLGHVLPSAHDMAREHRVLSGLNRVGFPTPRALALCEDVTVNGSPFLVMEFVDGRVISTADDAADLSAADADGACSTLVSTLADLHRVDAAEAGLADLGRPVGYLPRQLDRWSRQWDLTQVRPLPTMEALRARIADLLEPLPADLPWALVHGDYRLDNVILRRDSTDVAAVLDWEMSTLGDPLSDLALMLVYWTQADDGQRHLVPVGQHLTDGAGFWNRSGLIEGYAVASGGPVDHLDACTALACFKLAIITESIHARTLAGQQLGATAADADAMGAATEALAGLGLAVCRHGTVAGLSS